MGMIPPARQVRIGECECGYGGCILLGRTVGFEGVPRALNARLLSGASSWADAIRREGVGEETFGQGEGGVRDPRPTKTQNRAGAELYPYSRCIPRSRSYRCGRWDRESICKLSQGPNSQVRDKCCILYL
jgi:hypothetical protein